jgi:hypothetical protein
MFTTVVKESVNSIIGDQWYLNVELGMQKKPQGWKIKNSPQLKNLQARKTVQLTQQPLFAPDPSMFAVHQDFTKLDGNTSS